jgi:hypothetical protein
MMTISVAEWETDSVADNNRLPRSLAEGGLAHCPITTAVEVNVAVLVARQHRVLEAA